MELEASPITPLPLPILSGHLLRQIVLTESLLICVFCLRRWLSTKLVWCSLCGILKQGVPEDLDEFAEEILDEM